MGSTSLIIQLKVSSMFRNTVLLFLFLGINTLMVCSAYEDPAFKEEDLIFDEADQFTALREELEADLQDLLDERLDEVMSEMTALKGQLEALQAVFTSLPQESPAEAEQVEESPAEAEQDVESPSEEAEQDEESPAEEEAEQDEESPAEEAEQDEESPAED